MNSTDYRETLFNDFNKNLASFIDNNNGYSPIREFIAGGAYTNVFEIYPINVPSYDFKDPVLVMSLDKDKSKLFKAVTGLNILELTIDRMDRIYEDAKAECLSECSSMYDNEEEILENENVYDYINDFEPSFFFKDLIESGICIYITERVNSDLSELEVLHIEKALEVYSDTLRDQYGMFDNTGYAFSETDISISKENIEFSNSDSVELDKGLIAKYTDIINRDILKMSNLLLDCKVTLDLHIDQFIKINKEIFLIDSFVIEYTS